MKKLITIVIIVLGITSIAMAQQIRSNNYGCNMSGPCMNNSVNGNSINRERGYYKGRIGGCIYQNSNKQSPNISVKNTNDASIKIQEYLNNNGIKGFTIGSIETIERPRGLVYIINATDAAGNNVNFHINPWGNVMGPFFIK